MPIKSRWGIKKAFFSFIISSIALISLILLLLLINRDAVINFIAEKVYPNLAQPEETEAPLTFTTYPSSNQTEAIFGGQGAGLNCSIPSLVSKLVFNQTEGGDVSLRFRQACVMHDLCYRHGYATYGYTQADCDTQLQQSAFRLCRQFQKLNADKLTNVGKMYQSCELEGKKILLGVSLMGAGSFQDSSNSTYFEYDPMPTMADDYIVGRAIPEGQQPIKNPTADYGVSTFYFKRNTVEMRQLGTGSSRINSKAIFPDARLATPPILTRMTGLESEGLIGPLVSMVRDGYSDTSLDLVLFDLNHNKNPGQFSLMSCKGNCRSKTDASVRKFTVVDGKPVMVSLTHRGSPATVKIVQEEFPKPSSATMSDYSLNGPNGSVNYRYRFLSHDMLLEKNSSGEATWVWVFARGVPLKSGRIDVDSRGDNYENYLTVVRQRLGNDRENDVRRFSIDAKETDEPLSLIRIDNEGNNVLAAFSLSEEDLNLSQKGMSPKHLPQLKVWKPAGGEKQVLSFPMEMKENMTVLTPMVIRLSNLEFPLMIIPMVGKDRWENVDSQEKYNDGNLEIQFFISGIKTNSADKLEFSQVVKLKCDLNLNSQIQSQPTNVLVERFYRIIFGSSMKNKSDVFPETISAIKSDFARRWRMSQVIASERTIITDNQKENLEKMLALTMVFKGFPSMSFQLLLSMTPDKVKYVKNGSNPVCFIY